MGSMKGILVPQWQKLLHIPWILTHLRYYWLQNSQILRNGIPLMELLVLKYPFQIPTLKKPPILSVDVTDACDLQCEYCNNPSFPNPRTMMADEVFQKIVNQAKEHEISRIRIGGGEPTLHPKLSIFIHDLRPVAKHISITTNGQWNSGIIAEELIDSKPDLIEFSVDAGGKDIYEHSRHHASYERLMNNLEYIRKLRDEKKSKTILKIRLMLRPSTRHLEQVETKRLLKYVDIVIPQWLIQHPETNSVKDVFQHRSIAANQIPVCSLPFKDMQIRPDGNIPMCAFKGCTLELDQRIFLGNICRDSVIDIWNSQVMNELRKAHRTRKGEILEHCRNCHNG
ncbi:MAG TPA: radical SAM protein [Candidatus Cloacimonadota bacterium]|nr:radical SAM protein [Candidatus Cloacimonadota bacterium]HPT72391.1 radical SAM protein [Candidatus Cloacimonadota bacterium]